MEWVLVIVIVALGILFFVARRRAAIEKQRTSARDLQLVRGVAEEDVTRFGEELQELHIETLTTDLDPAMRQDYQRALDAYENAKALLRDATVSGDVTEATKALEDGRYAKACVLARQAGEPLPERRPPCFFNPAHGPAQTDAQWAPPGGIPREVPVCLADADRLTKAPTPTPGWCARATRWCPGTKAARRTAPTRGLLRLVGDERAVPGVHPGLDDGWLGWRRRLGR